MRSGWLAPNNEYDVPITRLPGTQARDLHD
jgi:hypothetical protein